MLHPHSAKTAHELQASLGNQEVDQPVVLDIIAGAATRGFLENRDVEGRRACWSGVVGGDAHGLSWWADKLAT